MAIKNTDCEFTKMKSIINGICIAIFPNTADVLARCDVSPSSQKFADRFEFSANHAMIIASYIKDSPANIAVKIIDAIKQHNITQEIANIEVNGGFMNIKMKPVFWQNVLLNIVNNGDYGFENYGAGQLVNIEYVSANPTGPMHIGHARGAVYGDVIANLLEKCGYKVTREYYINDAGAQINKVLDSILFRAKQIISADFTENLPEGCYPGEYIMTAAQAVLDEFGESIVKRDDAHSQIWHFVINYMLNVIKQDLARLGVFHSVFTSEKQITNDGKVEEMVSFLQDKGLIYKGVLEKPKGNETEDWESVEQMLFASSKFGDDVDRAMKKNDGSWAYFTPDIAYHYDKFQRKFEKMILVLGADHKGYKKRISAAVNAISNGAASVEVVLCELVNFVKNGQPVKMSKRSGNFLTLSDVLNEIDPQILRFFLIIKKNDTVVDFDFEKVMEQSKENPIFYIQYAYSRCCSLLKKAQSGGAFVSADIDYSTFMHMIKHDGQVAIIHKLSQYSKLIHHCVLTLSPHLIAAYLFELAGLFHSMWNVSNFRFISDDSNQTIANMILVSAVKNTIKSSLDCLGILPMERM